MTAADFETTAKRSRPGGRTARVTERLLDATIELIAERGFEGVTYDAVARRAGAGRATIHRKWPERDDLLSDALLRLARRTVVVPDTGDIRSDLVDMLCQIGATMETPIGRALLNSMMSDGVSESVEEVRRQVAEARTEVLAVRLAKAIQAGQIPPVEAGFLNAMLVGPIFVHVARDRHRFTPAVARRVVDVVLDGLIASERTSPP